MSSSIRFALCCLACLLGSAAGNMVSPGLGKCLDIKAEKKEGTDERETLADMEKKEGAINVQLYKCHEEHNQDWEIVDGQIKSQSLPDRCLTVDGEVAANSNVVLDTCGKDNQKWDLTAFGYVQSKGSEFCLDVKAAEVDGERETWEQIKEHTTVNVHLYNCHVATGPEKTDRVNQLWEWAPFSGDKVISAVQFLGRSILKPTTSGHSSMAMAAVGMASLFVAGIFIGLRVRQGSVQQPLASLTAE